MAGRRQQQIDVRNGTKLGTLANLWNGWRKNYTKKMLPEPFLKNG
jgi:hypothetical protein